MVVVVVVVLLLLLAAVRFMFALLRPFTPTPPPHTTQHNTTHTDYADNYLLVIFLCAVFHAAENWRFIVWAVFVCQGWNWTLKLNRRNEPTYFGAR